MTLDWAAQTSKLHQFSYAGGYALAPAPPKVPTSTQVLGWENSRTAETSKIFPQVPMCLRRLALRPACRTHSVDAAFADPSKTNPILALGVVISSKTTFIKTRPAWPGDAAVA